MAEFDLEESEHISLCETLDRVLNKGAVVVGDLTIAVADIDLLYLGLQVILASIETARGIFPIRSCPHFDPATERVEGSGGRVHSNA